MHEDAIDIVRKNFRYDFFFLILQIWNKMKIISLLTLHVHVESASYKYTSRRAAKKVQQKIKFLFHKLYYSLILFDLPSFSFILHPYWYTL